VRQRHTRCVARDRCELRANRRGRAPDTAEVHAHQPSDSSRRCPSASSTKRSRSI
jgi:hypothetical protein